MLEGLLGELTPRGGNIASGDGITRTQDLIRSVYVGPILPLGTDTPPPVGSGHPPGVVVPPRTVQEVVGPMPARDEGWSHSGVEPGWLDGETALPVLGTVPNKTLLIGGGVALLLFMNMGGGRR